MLTIWTTFVSFVIGRPVSWKHDEMLQCSFVEEQSRHFGFLRFATIDDAEAFMSRNYPTLYLYGKDDHATTGEDAKVHISYGRERKENRSDESDWNCSAVSWGKIASPMVSC
jgi:hypothetical protein